MLIDLKSQLGYSSPNCWRNMLMSFFRHIVVSISSKWIRTGYGWAIVLVYQYTRSCWLVNLNAIIVYYHKNITIIHSCHAGQSYDRFLLIFYFCSLDVWNFNRLTAHPITCTSDPWLSEWTKKEPSTLGDSDHLWLMLPRETR